MAGKMTMLDRLRNYYSKAPRSASAFRDDPFNFAVSRLGRRQHAIQDLNDLDRYAMEQMARGRYNPEELNALADQIEADRMLMEMDYDAYMNPRMEAAVRRANQYNADMDKWLTYQKGYAKLAKSQPLTEAEVDQFVPYLPSLKSRGYNSRDDLRRAAMDRPDELFEDIGDAGAYPDAYESWMGEAPYPKGPTGEELEMILPDDAQAYERGDFLPRQRNAIDAFRRANYRKLYQWDPFRTDMAEWRYSLGNKRYK